jgi:anti-sigma regulatory factor (Ser/Thr protein kinase)
MAEEVRMLPPAQSLEISHGDSVGEARRAARAMAASLGFQSQDCEEIAIVMTELATNLVKHARGGILTLTPLADNGRAGLEIRSHDDGPGIADVEQAIADHYSTTGTYGTGLGTVNRLMDNLDIKSRPGSGTSVVCRKWIRKHRHSLAVCPLAIGVATRPRPSEQENGDAFIVVHWSESALVGIIDGLGHGQPAHRAAQVARLYVESHFDQPLEDIFRGTCRACHSTRGVVMALARFDWSRGLMTFGSIGNISARIFPRSDRFHFLTRRGVVGLNAPRPAVREHQWPVDHVFVLHSDGVSTRWDLKEFKDWEKQQASAMAYELLHSKAKEEDDATVVVVRDVVS